MSGQHIFTLSEKLLTALEEAEATPSDGNTALLYTLVLSMHHSRPDMSPEEVANFLYKQILSLANEVKKRPPPKEG